jgi:hypothetical protein
VGLALGGQLFLERGDKFLGVVGGLFSRSFVVWSGT